MQVIEKIRKRVNVRKVLKGTLIFLIVFSITGFLILPPIIKSVLINKLSVMLNREVAIQTVRVNPFMLSVTVRGFEIKERGSKQTFVSFDEFYANLQTMSIFRRGVITKEMRLVKPYLNLVRNEDLTYNFTDLLQPKEKPDAKADALRFSLNNIRITQAKIDFMDGPRHTKHTVRDATLTVPFVSNLPYYLDEYVQPAFSATINDHSVAFTGTTKPFVDSLETNIDINVKDFDIPHYLAYSPVPLDFKLVSGFFDTQSSISYVQYENRKPTLSIKGASALKQFRVNDRSDSLLVSLPRVDVSVSSSDLLAGSVHFAKITVQSPEVNISLDRTGKLNLLALVPNVQKKHPVKKEVGTEGVPDTAEPEEKKPLPVIEADEIALAGGKVAFADSSEGRKFSTRLEDIQAKVSNFSTIKDKKTVAELSFRTDTQEAFNLTSSFSVVPLAAEGTVELKEVALNKYAPYYGRHVLFSVVDGRVGFATKYLFQKTGTEQDIRLSDLTTAITSLRLRKPGEKEDFLSIPELVVKETAIDLTKRDVLVGEVSTQKGQFVIERKDDGKLNIETLLPPQAVSITQPNKAPPQPKQKTAAEKPWTVTARKISLDRYKVKVEDRVPAEPVLLSIDQINFRGDNISTLKNAKGRVSLSLQIEKKGSVKANGTVGIEPVSAQLKLVTKDLPVMPVVPYFSDKVKILVLNGSLSSEGTLSVAYAKESGPKASYKGTASLNDFASVDKAEAEDFLKWNSLYLNAMDISYNPLRVDIGEVAVSDFYARVIIDPDGSINLQNIVEQNGNKTGQEEKKAEAEQETTAGGKNSVAAPTKDAAQKMVRIEKVTLQGGTVNFSDRFIKPNFSANMLEIGGRVTGLSTEETKMADVELRGKLDNYAPLEITGRINPLRDDLFVDLTISFKDMDLSPLTPYSGRYLGYTIEKGKLALSLRYLIEKKKLDAQNKILLDQFTLGSQVESPDATKLPVRLAIALLKNRRGEINLDIPVSGRIDDPEFSIGRIILKILVNLLVKAATSPFALLGALFGGGEELSYLEFEAGLSQIDEQGAKKLDTLIKALHDRPSLKLEIEGHADPEKDREGLKQFLFIRKVKAQKLKEVARKGEAVSVDEIKVEPAEYAKYLKAAYKQEKFPKPRNIIGMAKDLPVPEMEKLMLTHTEVKDEDLRTLASQRASKVKDLILKSNQVEPERIFLVEPKSLSPEKKEKLKDSRVDFRLK